MTDKERAVIEAARAYIKIGEGQPRYKAAFAWLKLRDALAALDADKPVCGNCGGICNPLSEGSGYCDVCKGTGRQP